MVLESLRSALVPRELDRPSPGPRDVLVQVEACAVCRTDLHVIDGDLPAPKLPLILGHEIVGRVISAGADVTDLPTSTRVGIPWLAWTCGECDYCKRGEENLCERALFTGYTRDGGFAEYTVADARYAFPLPQQPDAASLSPLLCAGLIGYRSYRMAGPAQRLGFYGFGAAAHILTQVAAHQGREVYAFTRPADHEGQAFARELGAVWAGGSNEPPPQALDAAILFAPAGELVPIALRAVRPGGRVVCAGIHMTDIPSFPYALLWRERSLCSVANLTRTDGLELFELIGKVPVQTHVERFELAAANEAIAALRAGKVRGAAVLTL